MALITAPAPVSAPGAPQGSPIPGADVYLADQARALKAWESSKALLAQRQGQIWQKAGMKGEFNPDTGLVSNQQVDPNNPYGDYQMMHQQNASELDSADEVASARGLRGAGLGRQASSLARFMQGSRSLAFGRGLMDQFQDIHSGYSGAMNTYNTSITDAQYRQAMLAAQTKMFTTAKAPGDTTDGANPAEPDWATLAQGGRDITRGGGDPTQGEPVYKPAGVAPGVGPWKDAPGSNTGEFNKAPTWPTPAPPAQNNLITQLAQAAAAYGAKQSTYTPATGNMTLTKAQQAIRQRSGRGQQ